MTVPPIAEGTPSRASFPRLAERCPPFFNVACRPFTIFRLCCTHAELPLMNRRFRLLYDGNCPICRREVSWLRNRDRAGNIELEDIAAPQFDPS